MALRNAQAPAGVLEAEVRTPTEAGTPQGAVISPLLANIYLHYAFDLWAERWRHRETYEEVTLVRFADDIVVGFAYELDISTSRFGGPCCTGGCSA